MPDQLGDTPPDGETPLDPFTVDRLIADPAAARDTAEQDLATLFAALRAPAEPEELAREGDHLAAFAAQALESELPTRRRTSVLASFLATKTAAAAAAVAAVTAAGAAGAYTGSLPTRLQNVAHDTIGAPAAEARSQRPDATPKPDPTTSPGGGRTIDATSPAAQGLCTAFAGGGLATTSTTYRTLAEAAGGAANIPAFCDTVEKRGSTARPTPAATGKPSDKPTGKPDDVGTGKPVDKPSATGKPDDLRTGKPTDAPGR